MYADGAPRLDRELLELGIPALADLVTACSCSQRSSAARSRAPRWGSSCRSDLTVREPGRLFAGLPVDQTCWMSHRDTVLEPPPGFTGARLVDGLARRRARVRAARDLRHPVPSRGRPHAVRAGRSSSASSATSAAPIARGARSRSSPSRSPASAPRWATARSSAASRAASIRASPRSSCTARSATSSPACSSITASCAKNEGEQVVAAFRDHFKAPLVAVEAEERFLARLAGVSDPETKRKAIGAEFIRVSRRRPRSRDASISSRARCTPTSSSPAAVRRGDDQVRSQLVGLPRT